MAHVKSKRKKSSELRIVSSVPSGGSSLHNSGILDDSSSSVDNCVGLKNAGTTAVPYFCLNEYVRLLVILRDHPRAREALLSSGRELSASALDVHMNRDQFWTSIDEKVFNDTSYRPTIVELTDVLNSVTPEAELLSFRSGPALKEWFRKLRFDFTEPYDH